MNKLDGFPTREYVAYNWPCVKTGFSRSNPQFEIVRPL